MEPQNTPNSQNNLEQRKKSDGIAIPDLNIPQGFPIQDNIDWAHGSTGRTMVPNRKPGTNSISTEKLISDKKNAKNIDQKENRLFNNTFNQKMEFLLEENYFYI